MSQSSPQRCVHLYVDWLAVQAHMLNAGNRATGSCTRFSVQQGGVTATPTNVKEGCLSEFSGLGRALLKKILDVCQCVLSLKALVQDLVAWLTLNCFSSSIASVQWPTLGSFDHAILSSVGKTWPLEDKMPFREWGDYCPSDRIMFSTCSIFFAVMCLKSWSFLFLQFFLDGARC